MTPISFARGAPSPACLDAELLASCASAAFARDGETILSYGPGGGYGYSGLNLTDEQRTKIAAIEEEVAKRQWDLMDKMHDQHYDLWRGDESASRKAYEVMSSARKAMFETSLEARKRIESVLTDEQRKQLQQRGWRGR